jgi:hypothetical protein
MLRVAVKETTHKPGHSLGSEGLGVRVVCGTCVLCVVCA